MFKIVQLIVHRELSQYFKTWSGYIFISILLLLTGLLYNAFAVGTSAKYSADVLSDFFFLASGTTMVCGLLLSMRVIAEENQAGSMPILTSAPITDGYIIIAKFLSAYIMTSIYIISTIFMPILIFWHGSVNLGHIFGGYVGLLFLGAASTAIGVLGSAAARSQLFAIVISSITLVFMLTLWLVARLVDGPFGDMIQYMALHHKHFRPFMDGTIKISSIIFYLSVILIFLTMARNLLEGQRWRS
ncbi:MAG: ABC transporter permease [Myxococcales bacterium]|nr:ABC transporter permease [Myxococcales bacterium]